MDDRTELERRLDEMERDIGVLQSQMALGMRIGIVLASGIFSMLTAIALHAFGVVP